MSCTECTTHACVSGAELPDGCTSHLAGADARERAVHFYNESENNAVVQASATTIEASIPGHWPRIRELVFFARTLGAKRIGIASCITFADEAKLLADILEDAGFETVSAICRIGSVTREEAGLVDDSDDRAQRVTCNPYMQADVLNEAHTDFNIIVGLCLGHDMLFTGRSEAWVTTLEIKDQSTKHERRLAASLKHYRAIEQLRQDLYDAALADSIGGCGSQLAAAQGVMGASEDQLLSMAHEAGLLLSRYGLQ